MLLRVSSPCSDPRPRRARVRGHPAQRRHRRRRERGRGAQDAARPGFRATAPDVELNVVGTGTGEPASRAIYTKIKAQADAGRKPWDIDVALVEHGRRVPDGEGGAAPPLRAADEERRARQGRRGEGGLRRHRRRLRGPDVPQPDRHRLSPVEGVRSAASRSTSSPRGSRPTPGASATTASRAA